MSALLGTTVFTSLQHADVAWVKTLMVVLSVSMIALTSLQTFFKYSERAERHKTAAVQIVKYVASLSRNCNLAQLTRPLRRPFARNGTPQIARPQLFRPASMSALRLSAVTLFRNRAAVVPNTALHPPAAALSLSGRG